MHWKVIIKGFIKYGTIEVWEISQNLGWFMKDCITNYTQKWGGQCMHSVGFVMNSVTSKKSPNVYKKFPKNDFTTKMKVFEGFTKIA